MKGVYSISILLFFLVTASCSPVDRFDANDNLDDDFLDAEDSEEDLAPDGRPFVDIVSTPSFAIIVLFCFVNFFF